MGKASNDLKELLYETETLRLYYETSGSSGLISSSIRESTVGKDGFEYTLLLGGWTVLARERARATKKAIETLHEKIRPDALAHVEKVKAREARRLAELALKEAQ